MEKIKEILIGTNNDGKYREISYLLPKKVKKIHNNSYQDLNIEPIEDKFKKKCGFEIDITDIKFLKERILEVQKTFNNKIKNIEEFYKEHDLNHLEGSKRAYQIINEILLKKQN